MNASNKLVLFGESLVSCLWGRLGAYLSVAPFKCSSLWQTLALPANVTADWKNLQGANTPAYYQDL